jgi:Flp pilus assembly protein TadD
MARQNLALAYALMGNTNAAKQILQADLPPASVEDNLRFYQILRARLGAQGGAPSPAASGALPAAAAPHDGELRK